jgi:hypothetical protein
VSQIQRTKDVDRIEQLASFLSKSEDRQAVFRTIYSGGASPKTSDTIAHSTGLDRIRVLQIATALSNAGNVAMQKDSRRNLYSKIKDLIGRRDQILRLARNKERLQKLSAPAAINVTVQSKSKVGFRIDVDFVRIDDIKNFAKAHSITRSRAIKLKPPRLPEKQFKYGLAKILGESGTFTDWGGEKNDLYATNLMIRSKRLRGAIALKGPATKPPLNLRKLGAGANQIPKLFQSTADVFLIQFEGQIDEEVIEQMETYAVGYSKKKGQKVCFGVIADEDSRRLRIAYKQQFKAAANEASSK